MTAGAWVLIAAVAVALVFGAYRAWTDGRFGRTPPVETPWDDLDIQLGERATLLQFSSAFCAPCRATRRVLADVAAAVPGVAHVEIDAEEHLDLVRRVGVARTPTTLVLDARGHEITRATGAPRKEQVLSALRNAVSENEMGTGSEQ